MNQNEYKEYTSISKVSNSCLIIPQNDIITIIKSKEYNNIEALIGEVIPLKGELDGMYGKILSIDENTFMVENIPVIDETKFGKDNINENKL